MVSCAHFIRLDTQILKPFDTVFPPVIEPIKVRIGLAEELKLHLLELSCPECKVTGSYLVPEGLSDLTDSEGHLFS